MIDFKKRAEERQLTANAYPHFSINVEKAHVKIKLLINMILLYSLDTVCMIVLYDYDQV